MFAFLLAVLMAAPDGGTLVQVVSVPEAEVTLDEKFAGFTPMLLEIPNGGKHTLVVTRDGWSKIKRVLTKVKERELLKFELVDLELAALKAKVAKAQAGYDKANAKLEQAQARVRNAPEPSTALEDQVTAADEAMQKASEALDTATEELHAGEKVRVTEQKTELEARRTREALLAAKPPGAREAPSVFCAYDAPRGDKSGKSIEMSSCSPGPLQLAVVECQLHSRVKSRSASACRCSADSDLVSNRCPAGP